MKIIILNLTLILLIIAFQSIICFSFEPKTGDIFFQESGRSDFTDAIKSVTNSWEDRNFSHCGICFVDSNSTPPQAYIIEAITEVGVTITPLEKFLKRDTNINGKPQVAVGRINDTLQFTIPHAVVYAMKLRGKQYDYAFDLDNDKYYCSELVYLAFRDEKQKPIFDVAPMTFINANTKQIDENWSKFFTEHNVPIPEGKLGCNPGGLSQSKILTIIYSYY